VGTREYHWIDQGRPESFTRDPADHRHVMVQVWYPAPVPVAGAERSLWIRNLDEYKGSPEFKEVAHVRTNSVLDAPVLDGRWPVLIYNPGGGMQRWSGTFTAEMLASHGYVVFALDHAGFSPTTDFPDGFKFAIDTLGPPKATKDMAVDARAFFDWLEQQPFPVWLADSRFLLDQAETLNQNAGPFQDRLDMAKVGALGWSFGGATSIQLTRSDLRVKVAVDQDGQLFGDVKTQGTTRPILVLHNTSDPLASIPADKKAMMAPIVTEVLAGDSTAVARSTGPVVEVDLARAGHIHFSDLTLFYPPDSTQLTARRAHEIINALTLAFFERYLLGKTGVKLPEFPEAKVRLRK
jgi:predicted dienelactone hydrolase